MMMIPDYLTLEDFVEFSKKTIEIEDMYFYKVIISEYVKYDHSYKYPSIKLQNTEMIFKTLSDVEDYIMNRTKESSNIYCIKLIQTPWGRLSQYHGAQWLFDSKGVCVDFCPVHSKELECAYSVFYGRNRQRFQKGDFVEVQVGNTVELGIFYQNPPEPFASYEVYKGWKMGANKLLDASNDVCEVYIAPFGTMTLTSPLNLMSAQYDIPSELRNNMLMWLKKIDNE